MSEEKADLKSVDLRALVSSIPEGQTFEAACPDHPEFVVTMKLLDKELMEKLVEKSTVQIGGASSPAEATKFNKSLFYRRLGEDVIVGWVGLSVEGFTDLIASPVKFDGVDPKAPIECTPDNVRILFERSRIFDQWIGKVLGEMENKARELRERTEKN